MSVASENDQGSSSGEISYRFCQEWSVSMSCPGAQANSISSSNLLYPREDRQLNKLLYLCKACSSVQEHDSACTYRQKLSDAAQESIGEKAYVANDPTVGDENLLCTMCGSWLKCRVCGTHVLEESYESDPGLDNSKSTSS